MVEEPNNYADAPKSVGEARARKERDASKWTPRDALVSLLRDIDNGMVIDGLVMFYHRPEDNETFFSAATKTKREALGLVELGKHYMLNPRN